MHPQTARDVGIDMVQGDDGIPMLSLAMKPKEMTIPVRAPVCLYTHRVISGQLGMRFLRYKQNAYDRVEKTLQITITTDDIDSLTGLAKMLDKALMRARSGGKHAGGKPTAHRRPLASRPVNSSLAPLGGGGGAFSLAGKQQRPSAAVDTEDLPPLSNEQQMALNLVKSGKNIFFTGCAGTGKSLLIRHIIKAIPEVDVTGTTGLAGCLLGGTTINAWSGVGRAEGSFETVVRNASRGESGQRWRKCQALIIDEVSMLDGQFFDLLEAVARKVRGNSRPFGGIQLILSGDFHQLPPVVKDQLLRRFAFESESWQRCIHASVQLTKVFRQNDREFIDILAEIRAGTAPESTLRALLARCSAPLDLEDGILPTQLFTHRADVDAINDRQLNSLDGNLVNFTAQDSGDVAALQAACPAPRTLKLKVGAQVMLTRNLSSRQGLVNGARGVVEKFTPSGLPVIKFALGGDSMTIGRERYSIRQGGQDVAVRSQIPLALAWAVTVHKSQGLTLDRVEVSLDRAFEAGMAYVALSRARNLEGLRIVGSIASAALRADPKVVEFYSKLQCR
jgi:ATP-dependent DNA helicase PIF1